MATHSSTVRADMTVELPDGTTDTAVVIIAPETQRSFVAFRSTGWRALMPLDWGEGRVVKSTGDKPVDYGVDEPLAGTDLRAIEFFPFWDGDLKTAFISDTSRNEKTVTLYASDEVPYILFVITFDKTTLVPLSTKYFRDRMSNLVRLRKDSDHVMVGSRPRPRKIEITDYSENQTTKIDLTWRTLDTVPTELLSEGTFDKATIDWGDGTVAGH
ncbi:MAG: hypothetical protein V3R77_03655 [Candidatus Binatia bacterium]